MSHLFDPICIGKLKIKNRTMFAPMENGMATHKGEVTDQLINFYRLIAKNEIGILMSGSIAVSPEGRGLPTQLNLYTLEQAQDLKRLTKVVHSEGSLIGAQIYHSGRQSSEDITGYQPLAPSAIPCPSMNNHPAELTTVQMEEIKGKFVQTAKWCVCAGFDLIEVHFAHGYLLHSFLSPHSNQRTDGYGGSLENRLRYPMYVLNAIIEAVGESVPVTIRISIEEFLDDGLKVNEAMTVCRKVEEAGVKAISVSAGSYDSTKYSIQPPSVPKGFLIPYAEKLKSLISIPVIVAGRLSSADLIKDIIVSRKADMVAIGRGLLADPEIIKKIKEHRDSEIRYCIACNKGCLGSILEGNPMYCILEKTR